MEHTEWKQYLFPHNIIIEICDKLGKEVNIENIIDYHILYFMGEGSTNLNQPKDLNKSLRWVEDKIYKDCEGEDWKAEYIFRILAWKTGKIDYSRTPEIYKNGTKIEYYKNWVENEERFDSFQIPNQSVVEWKDFESIANQIIKIRANYSKSKKEVQDAQKAWQELLVLANNQDNKAMRGIGTVYLITLLHFITDNEYPIFDRFAMASLVAWKLKSIEKNKVKITDKTIVRGCSLPSKNTKAAQNILKTGIYTDYIKLLKEFCKEYCNNEDEWKTNRNVDRSLWVFGHFFNVI